MLDDTTRRDFLKAAAFALAGIAGASGLAGISYAQENQEKKKKDEDEKEEPNYEDLLNSKPPEDEETRACPQCGALMYRQGRTWTCENCGYSYVE
ncbi:MAG TPA: twin-arginine translocation signal domain-containing protein [Vicinamibacteria bacterium]|nr:twin-arginine translocation signal domain-containing protein [Vicinamibacteria bacterium]